VVQQQNLKDFLEQAERRLESVLPFGLRPALDTGQCALLTGLSPATLETMRSRGGGPPFVRYGRKAVRYRPADVDAWMAERIKTVEQKEA